MSNDFWKGFWAGIAQAIVVLLPPAVFFVAGYYVALGHVPGVTP